MGKHGELPRTLTCTIHYVASALPDTRPWGGPKAEIKHSIASKTLSATKGRHPIAQIAQIALPLVGLPAMSVSTGLVDGVPSGVQLVAAPWREDVCLAAGEVLEAAFGIPPLAAGAAG